MNCPACGAPNHRFAFEKNGYPIQSCEACRSFFVDPMPGGDEIAAFYNDYYKTAQYAGKLKSKIRRARRRIRSLGRAAGRSFLDVGCNVGFAVEAARDLGYRARGIDLAAEAIETARGLFPGCEFSADNVVDVAASGERYDVVYSSEVVEHLSEPDRFMAAVHAVLAEGGTLYMTTPDIGHFSLPRDESRLGQWNNFRPPEHLIYFTKKGLRALLERNGFRDVRFQFSFKPTIRVVASK